MTHHCLFCKNELIKKPSGCYLYNYKCLSCKLDYHLNYLDNLEKIASIRLDIDNFYIEYTKYWYQDKVMLNIVSRITKYDTNVMHKTYIEEKNIYHIEYDDWNNLISPQQWIKKLPILINFS